MYKWCIWPNVQHELSTQDSSNTCDLHSRFVHYTGLAHNTYVGSAESQVCCTPLFCAFDVMNKKEQGRVRCIRWSHIRSLHTSLFKKHVPLEGWKEKEQPRLPLLHFFSKMCEIALAWNNHRSLLSFTEQECVFITNDNFQNKPEEIASVNIQTSLISNETKSGLSTGHLLWWSWLSRNSGRERFLLTLTLRSFNWNGTYDLLLANV